MTPRFPFVTAKRILDRAIAWYFPEHVLTGYKFFMEHYADGDKIFIFGLSANDIFVGKLPNWGDFIGRIFSWRLHCPRTCGHASQGMIHCLLVYPVCP
jgi:Uncharacterized alpha/beta hydrolase domain (DUF2235)